MGEVYQAEDTKLKRLVAIKCMAPDSLRNRESLLKEAQRASALNHPNIAAIYDVVEGGEELLLVMECVEGTTLRQLLSHGTKFALEEVYDIARQCADGLGAAHDKGILHGDIKPENIMLTPEGRVKILDFGVARRFTLVDAEQPTSTLASLSLQSSGTPAYMSPEVLMQRQYDGRADIFSLGLVLFELLTGEQPFKSDTLAGTIGRVLHEEPPALDKVNPSVPRGLSALVGEMLTKDSARRYPSVKKLSADLARIQAGRSVDASAAARGPRSQWMKFGAVAAAVLLVAVAFVSLRGRKAINLGGAGGPEAHTLAVLPFEADAGDLESNSFGTGLIESLTSDLAQLGDAHPLQVVSSAELRQKHVTQLEQARKEFSADAALKVSLRRAGDALKVTYTLSDTKTGKAFASQTLETRVSDPFAIEDKIIDGVASALRISLSADERRTLADHGTRSPEAFRDYMQARGHLDDSNGTPNPDSAIILLNEALRADPDYGKAKALLGSAFWTKFRATNDRKLVEQAREACMQAIAAGNAGAAGHVCLGTVDNGTGNYEKAVEEFRRALQLELTNDDAYIGLASAYERMQNPAEAERTYTRVVQLRPRYWRGYNLLGVFYLRQAQYDQAAEMFRKVIELTPESYRGYANLGAALLTNGKYKEAIAPLQQSLAIHATPDTYSNLASAHYFLRQFDEAAQIYEQAVHLRDGDYILCGNLAEALYLAGQHDKASEAYKKARALAEEKLNVNPRDPEVFKNLADYSAMLGERTDAFRYLDKALQFSKYDKETLFAAGLIHNQFGETGQALEWIHKALLAGYSVDTITQSPSLDNLRSDVRFQRLIAGK